MANRKSQRKNPHSLANDLAIAANVMVRDDFILSDHEAARIALKLAELSGAFGALAEGSNG